MHQIIVTFLSSFCWHLNSLFSSGLRIPWFLVGWEIFFIAAWTPGVLCSKTLPIPWSLGSSLSLCWHSCLWYLSFILPPSWLCGYLGLAFVGAFAACTYCYCWVVGSLSIHSEIQEAMQKPWDLPPCCFSDHIKSKLVHPLFSSFQISLMLVLYRMQSL